MLRLILFHVVTIYLTSSCSQDYNSSEGDDYVSLESDESDVNEPNVTKTVYAKPDVQLESNNTDFTKDNKVDTSMEQKPPKHLKTVDSVNTTTSYKCGETNSESSEEDRCKMTLHYPFSVSIQKKGAHYASGALLDKQTVLTVARDFFNVRESIKMYRARLGSVDCKSGGILLPIKSVDVHPSYIYGQPAFDIAVLKLASPVNLTTYIQPIAVSKEKQKVISVNKAKFLTTYWPRVVVQGEILPKSAKERVKHHSMRVSTQKLIPWKNCFSLMKSRGSTLDRTSMCLKPIATHHSICKPDVGAPVVADDGLWGITSGWTSDSCEIRRSPTIFTRVSSQPVQLWLRQVL